MDESSKLPKLETPVSSSPVTFSASSEKNSEASDMEKVTSVVDDGKPKGLGFLKFRLKFTKRILPIILMGLGVAFLTLVGVVTYLYVKESAVKIHDVRITNIADGSATVSWVSEQKSKGVVYYGEIDSWTPIFTFAGKEREDDDRDVEFNKDGDEVLLDGGRKEYFTHHVTIEDLEPNTRYFFRIGTGVVKGFGSDSDGNEVKPIETAPVIESLSTPNPAYGRVFKFDGSAVEDGIVFYRVTKDGSNLSSTLSTTVSNGTWSVDLSNARDVTLSERMILGEDQTHILEFDTADGAASVDITNLQYQPVNDVLLNSDQGNLSGEEVKDRFGGDKASGFSLIGKVSACQAPYRECCGPNSSRSVTVTCDSNDNPISWATGACESGDAACGAAEGGGGGGGGSTECPAGKQYDPAIGDCVCVATGGCGDTDYGESDGGGSGGGTGGGQAGGGGTGGGTLVADTSEGGQYQCYFSTQAGCNAYCGSGKTGVLDPSGCVAGKNNCKCYTGGTGGGGASAGAEGGGEESSGTGGSGGSGSSSCGVNTGCLKCGCYPPYYECTDIFIENTCTPLNSANIPVALPDYCQPVEGLSCGSTCEINYCGAGANLYGYCDCNQETESDGCLDPGYDDCIDRYGGTDSCPDTYQGTHLETFADSACDTGYHCSCVQNDDSKVKEGGLIVAGNSLPEVTSVLGIQDLPYEIEVKDTGTYLLVSDLIEGGAKEVEMFVPDGSTGKIRFFFDLNSNGIKDENEEYSTVDLEIQLETKQVSILYSLKSGWNLLGMPLFPAEGQRTANGLLDKINDDGGFATHIAAYRDGQFLVYSQRDGLEFGNDFNILPGEAYFIRNYNALQFYLSGNKFTESVPVDLSNGWNLVSIIKPNSTLSAEAVLDSMIAQGITSDALSRYQSGLYTSVIKQNGELFGRDFNIVQTNGYFVRVKDGGGKRWTP